MTTDPAAHSVDFAAIENAVARIAGHAHHTPVWRSHSIDALVGAQLSFKCENFQRAGAFKFRGACNAVWALPDAIAKHGVVTHSSGNHGAALALAAKTRGIPAHVVVPEGAVRSKVAAIEAYGAILHRCAATTSAREQAAEEVRLASGASLIHPYSNPYVIAGQATASVELLREMGEVEIMLAPVGGGGLVSGTTLACRALSPSTQVYAAEPEGAADTYASLQQGARIAGFVPNTICDGLRTLVGQINFEILQQHSVRVLPVSDAQTIQAMRLIWERLKIIVEPSSATVLAAVLRYPDLFAGRRVGLILSGGNVDLDALPWLN